MNTLKQRYDQATWTVLASIIITIFILFSEFKQDSTLHHVSERLDQLFYDIRFNLSLRYKKGSEKSHKILIVDIDEQSLKQIGRWPWNRKVIAQLTQNLLDAGAAVITFDVIFSEPERNLISELQSGLPPNNQPLIRYLDTLKDNYDNDQILAKTFSQHDIVLGFIFHSEPLASTSPPNPNIISVNKDIEKIAVPQMRGITANIPILQKNILAEGFINGPPDNDGIVRRAPLIYSYENQFYSSLALQTALAYSLVERAELHSVAYGETLAVTGISINEKTIVTDEQGRMLIPYRGRHGHFSYVPATDILNGNFDQSLFNGAIVLIGTSAVGLADLRGTPVGIQYPGVESQATIIDAILTGDIPYKPDWAIAANLISIIVIFFVLNAIFPLCGPLAMLLTGLCIGAIVVGINFSFWHYKGIDLPLSGQLVEALLIFIAYLSYGFFFSSDQKNRIRNMFGQYVAPGHIEKLMNDPNKLSFEGETKEMTVMFCDIRRFTSISEKLTANQLKDFLNRYFTPMTEIIFSQQGTIDKYVGDMIMAFWGAPLDDPDQRMHAITTALMMIEKTADMKAALKERGYPEVNIGIGINTGIMNVGDMGSVYRRAYTVLGDAVNLGSRLESITKFYGANILVSEATISPVADKFLYREVDYIQVKGKEDPIRVYEPLALLDKATTEQANFVREFHEARKIFLTRNWPDAKAAFRQLIQADPGSTLLYSVYIERCIMYSVTPPDQDWQGVWKHDSK